MSMCRTVDASWRRQRALLGCLTARPGCGGACSWSVFRPTASREAVQAAKAKEKENQGHPSALMKQVFATQNDSKEKRLRPLANIPVHKAPVLFQRPKDKARAEAFSFTKEKVEKPRHDRDREIEEPPSDSSIMKSLDWEYAHSFKFQGGSLNSLKSRLAVTTPFGPAERLVPMFHTRTEKESRTWAGPAGR